MRVTTSYAVHTTRSRHLETSVIVKWRTRVNAGQDPVPVNSILSFFSHLSVCPFIITHNAHDRAGDSSLQRSSLTHSDYIHCVLHLAKRGRYIQIFVLNVGYITPLLKLLMSWVIKTPAALANSLVFGFFLV